MGNGRAQEYPELVVASLDMTSALETRLAEVEQRVSSLLRDVEFLEEFRQLFQEARERDAGPSFGVVARPPSAPRPAWVRPTQSAAGPIPKEEIPSPANPVDALEARLAKLEALDFEGLSKVKDLECAVAQERLETSTQLVQLTTMLNSQQEEMAKQLESMESTLWPKLAAETEKATAAEVSKVAEIAAKINTRQTSMESQFEEFGRTLLGLLSDVQVHTAQTEFRLGLLERAPEASGEPPEPASE